MATTKNVSLKVINLQYDNTTNYKFKEEEEKLIKIYRINYV